jgi:caffeoyl-CoA O-methyltransferase
MDEKYTTLTPALYQYLLDHNPAEDEVLRALAAETLEVGALAIMQVAREQGLLLTTLTRLVGARRAVEIGTFTGYSSICIARGLADGGHLLACDVSEEWTAIARKYWARAGLQDRIELRIGPAVETLAALPDTPEIDLAFIDADKTSYRAYYDALLPRLRPNGLIVFDNVLWMGAVVNPEAQDESTVAIRALNDFLLTDERVDVVMLPVADGITLVRKR